jgi:hypothetical protein
VFSALLDTCVLVPSRARDVLLEVASTGACRPLRSSEILAELDRALRMLLGKRGVSQEETDAYLTRLFRQMETAFPDALVTGWESLAGTVRLPDPDDRHVVTGRHGRVVAGGLTMGYLGTGLPGHSSQTRTGLPGAPATGAALITPMVMRCPWVSDPMQAGRPPPCQTP